MSWLMAVVLMGCQSDYRLEGGDVGRAGCESAERAPGEPDPCRDVCPASTAPETSIDPEVECVPRGLNIENPWAVNIEWQLPLNGEQGSFSAPKVGPLLDTNGDGVADARDVPAVVVVTYQDLEQGTLRVLRGDTGAEVWSMPNVYGGADVALGDVDGDRQADVIVFDAAQVMLALDRNGSLIWSAPLANAAYYIHPMFTLADLEGDGQVEIITNDSILNGRTGQRIQQLSPEPNIVYTLPSVGDINLDGRQEIVLGNKVFDADGRLLWQTGVVGDYGHWSAIVDVDGDPEGEVIMVGSGVVEVLDADGTVLERTVTRSARQPGPPCVADFDGDGQVEIAWPSQGVFAAFELDATPLWSTTVQDNSGLAGCSGYDFDGDGVYEILYADERELQVFDGATGETLFSVSEHRSLTIFEYPTIADIDLDGSTEILYTSSGAGSPASVTALGHETSGWLRAGTAWGLHDFAVTNAPPSGRIPGPTPYWQEHNVYRARPVVDLADLQLALRDACASSCVDDEGTLTLTLDVHNAGTGALLSPVDISLYRYDQGVVSLLETHTVIEPLAGQSVTPVTFYIDVEDIGISGLIARVDDPGGEPRGGIEECIDTNNELYLVSLPCMD
ncbi:MAG: hypothetical protein AAFV53_15830 [Myxococcota bacterium]